MRFQRVGSRGVDSTGFAFDLQRSTRGFSHAAAVCSATNKRVCVCWHMACDMYMCANLRVGLPMDFVFVSLWWLRVFMLVLHEL
jgi:hypothetical protein